jgi:DNA-binding Lrp family transcriptional regulator
VSGETIDDLDRRLLWELSERPRAGVMDLARRLGVARGTVQSRLQKLQDRGVITGFGPDVDLGALGYHVLAFTELEIAQGTVDKVLEHLATIPEVLEAHTTTGSSDLHVRLVARDNPHLQAVINRVLRVDGIVRTTTKIALTEPIPLRHLPLLCETPAGDDA